MNKVTSSSLGLNENRNGPQVGDARPQQRPQTLQAVQEEDEDEV